MLFSLKYWIRIWNPDPKHCLRTETPTPKSQWKGQRQKFMYGKRQKITTCFFYIKKHANRRIIIIILQILPRRWRRWRLKTAWKEWTNSWRRPSWILSEKRGIFLTWRQNISTYLHFHITTRKTVQWGK
jgi:hypothetical protein